MANDFLFGAFTYLGISAYLSILYHWIQIYNITIETLHRGHTIMNANASYRGNLLTISSMFHQIRNLKVILIFFLSFIFLIEAENSIFVNFFNFFWTTDKHLSH